LERRGGIEGAFCVDAAGGDAGTTVEFVCEETGREERRYNVER
jgi:hypothetical protein